VDFLLAWIQKESYGNPCSWTSLREAGIFQLMIGDNQRDGGTTEAALRAACVAAPSQSLARTLSDAEANEQVRSGVQYVRAMRDNARRKLAAVGANWPESSTDFGKMVKFEHVLPGRTATWLAAAKAGLGRAPANWKELVPFAPAAGIPSNWVANADWVGSYWNGSGPGEIPIIPIAVAVGAGVLYYLLRRRRR
jgi:hypothetical protein